MIKKSFKDDEIIVAVRVIPRSSKSEIVGEHDGALKVKLTSPPVGGAANAELIKLVAKKLGVPRSSVAIASGETSKTKQIRITGVTAAELQKCLAASDHLLPDKTFPQMYVNESD